MKYNSSKKCAYFSDQYYKSLSNNFNSPKITFISNLKYLNKENFTNICINHNEILDIYCFTCSKDICKNCLKYHSSHKIVKYTDIIPPSNEEIDILKNRIKSQKERNDQLLYEIKKWKHILEQKINYLEEIFSSNKLLNFINNFEKNSNNIKKIIKFKEIYSLITSQELNCNIDNENLNNLGYLNQEQYILCKYLIDNLNLHKNEFINNGIEIIKFLSEFSIYNYNKFNSNDNNIQTLKLNISRLKENTNPNYEFLNEKINTNSTYSLKEKYNTNTYNENLRLINGKKYTSCFEIYSKNVRNSLNNNGRFIQKDEDINSSSNLNNSYNTFDSINNCTFNKDLIYNISSSFNKNKNYKKLYSKKLINNVLRINVSDNILNKSAIIDSKNLFDFKKENNNSNKKILTLKLPVKRDSLNFSLESNKKIINYSDSNNNNNYTKCKNNNNKIYEIKYFTHKKFNNNKNLDYSYNSLNNNLKKKSNTEKTKTTKYINNKIITKKYCSTPIKSNLFIDTQKTQFYNNIETNNDNKDNFNEEKDFCIRIVKTTEEKKFRINPYKPLCIGLNLDNSNCKLGIIDQNNNDIQLICFKKDSYEIPTIIYLDENDEDIKIGYEAESLKDNYPKQTIFNLVKLFGTDFNEIKDKKNFLPFNINEENNGRIYIKINYCGKKNKIYYIENLLILFFEYLFKKLFDKILIEEDKLKDKNKFDLNSLNINICVTVPNYFNYIKRKVLEKIFQKHIFQNLNISINYNFNYNYDINNINNNNSSLSSSKQSTFSTTTNFVNINNNYNKKNKNIKLLEIKLNNIKIENSPCPSVLCLQNINNNDDSISSSFSFQSCSKENNILILNVSGDSTDISITSISNEKKQIDNNPSNNYKYIKKYEVKNINSLNFGEEDFINNYLFDTIKLLNIELYNDILNNPNTFSQIKNIFSNNIRKFDIEPEIAIKLNDIINNYNLNIVLNKQDYIKSNSELLSKIISSIKNILEQSKLSEIQIDDIILIGRESKTNYMKKILSDIFKNNKMINNKLSSINENSFENDEFYLASGTALEAMNNSLKNISKKYYFINICPISLGIENFLGEVDLFIKKGNKIPIKQKNLVKIKRTKDSDFVDIKICEINNNNKKVVLSCSNINLKAMKIFPSIGSDDKYENKFIELLFEFEIDDNFNLSVFILDKQTFKRRFEFSINIDIIKNK